MATSFDPKKLLQPAFLNLTGSTDIEGTDQVIFYDTSKDETYKINVNDLLNGLSGGTGSANAYSYITDGDKIASASGADTFTLTSANNLLSIVVGELPNDRATFTVNQQNLILNLSQISGITASEIEINYLSGVTSNVQEQLDNFTSGLTTNYVPIFNGSNFSNSRIYQTGEATTITANAAPAQTKIFEILGTYGSTNLNSNGLQAWALYDSLNAYSGNLSYSTPSGNPGIIFFNNVGTKRSDFRQYEQTNGGLYFGVDVVGGATTKYMAFKNASTGQLGINKDPSEPLDVLGNIKSSQNLIGRQLSLANDSPTATNNSVSCGGGNVQIRADNSVFIARGSTRMITANSNGVAIGTSSAPSYPLDITTGGVRIQAQNAEPVSGAKGLLYTNNITNRFYFHDGSIYQKFLFESDDLTQYSLSNGTRWTSVQTPERVVISNSAGTLTVADVTTTELSYLSGVTSNIQEQIDNSTILNSSPISGETSGLKTTFVAFDDQVFADAVFINFTGQTQIADATSISTSGAIALCAESVLSGQTGTYLLQGFISYTGWTWDVGQIIYLSTSGVNTDTLTQTPPTGQDNVIQVLGVATDVDKMYFNPQLVQLEYQI